MKSACITCKFFGEGEPAHCRRYPPQALDGQNTTFPLVKPEWNCGEYKWRWFTLNKAELAN
jgi:hypothetical protein